MMNTSKQHFGFSQKLIVLSVLAAFGPAHAEEDIAQYIKPDSSVSVGLGVASGDSKDRAIFGQYNGMRKDDASLLLDFDIVKRDDATGLWTNFEGRNLGLDNRELRFSQNKQGDWKYSAEYNEITRHDIRTINTGLQGAGTTTPSVVRLATPGAGTDLNLDLKRKGLSLGVEKWLTPNLQFEANFKNEDKDGARLFGKGFACTSGAAPAQAGQIGCTAGVTQWALLMLPEPVNSTTKQFETKLNFSGEKFMVSGGYYGSFFTNANGSLTPTVPGTLNNPLGAPTALSGGLTGIQGILGMPMALPPDNQAHQLYVSGNYAFTPTTRATFKYAYTHATQNEDFGSMGLTGAPAGISNLGGVVDSSLVQLGLTARPMAKLSLLANVRYEDKKDKTPIAYYNVEGVTTTPANFFTNGLTSSKRLAGKLEASYQLPDNYRATLGVNYDMLDRGTPDSTDKVAGLSALRAKTEETGYRAELRRSMSETLNAAVSYVSSKREGSDWYSLQTSAAAIAAGAGYGSIVPAGTIVGVSPTAIFPMSMSDRERDKVRVAVDWDPSNQLSLQLIVEDGRDRYTTAGIKGMRDTNMRSYSLNAVYTLSEAWKLTGYWAQGDQTLDHVNHSTGYIAALDNVSTTVGLGVVGRPTSRLEVGGDLSYINDITKYGLTADQTTTGTTLVNNTAQAAIGLPDVVYRQSRLNLFGKYALEKNADIRVDFIHQRTKLDEWTWGYNGVPFAYSDNATVALNQNQNVTFAGVRYIYKLK
ncbi:MtrB/PioB family decaheme-associated outer membrane protein [Sulfuricella sp.]|uniref:MtrB/PioB family decaheme-associated outer membrane protein n=1 Tax=Sulfuricella sp. TaxID=2099377 RepID=UPI002D7FA116|nr:MtrB/PioB family decaheme-associated outer membrane protein [Sulfuricella sp.]